MSESESHVWTKVYYWDKKSPPVQLSITVGSKSDSPEVLVETAEVLAQTVLAKGLYADYPTGEEDLDPGQSLCEADSVIRRHFTRQDGQEADLVDFYADGLEHRVNYWYINKDRDKAYLEHATGLVFDSMPVVESYSTVSRPQGKPHPHEQRLPSRMKIVRDPQIDKKTGQQKTFGEHLQWWFNRFLGIPWEEAPESPTTKVDLPPAHLTKEEYESWETRIVMPGQSPAKLIGIMREAMAEKLPKLIEENHEKMMVMVPEDIEGLKLLEWLGFDADWAIKMFKETLGYKSMYGGYRIIQTKQMVDMFEGNFLFQCVELTEDDRVMAQRLLDQTVDEALEIERRYSEEKEVKE